MIKGIEEVISIVDGNLSIDVEQENLANVLRTIARLGGIDMVLFDGVRDTVDLKLDNIPVDEAIKIALSGTRFTYKQEGNMYLVGDKSLNSPASSLLTVSELIHIQYLRAEEVPRLLPSNFPSSNVRVVKEQNAILATGTQSDINSLKKHIAKIDEKIPQIVVEALIVEVSHSEGESPISRVSMNYDDERTLLDTAMGQLNYRSVMRLPTDFNFRIQSLVNKGEATVKARPNITTLNGRKARIDVGTVQYYRITDDDDDGDSRTRYQSVNAGVTLDVTPWVSSSGEITIEVNPSVSNIGGAVTDGPPQVSRREANTTVRVKDGETIVIGGLIQDVTSESWSKVPLLGDIPLLGRLFRSKNTDVNQTELVIYLTPRVLDEDRDYSEDMERMIEKTERVMD